MVRIKFVYELMESELGGENRSDRKVINKLALSYSLLKVVDLPSCK